MIKKMDHIGVVVKDLNSAIKNYTEMFGFKVVEKMDGPSGEFKNAMLQQGEVRVELFQPLKEGASPDSSRKKAAASIIYPLLRTI